MNEIAPATEETPPISGRPRVYLAGPDVFLPNACDVGSAKCELAGRYGIEGVFPLDAALDLNGLAPNEQARRISLANEGLMRSCDAIVANLSPFRGVSLDAGTAFEVGFMRALAKPIAGYTTSRIDYAGRTRSFRAQAGAATLPFDIDTPALDIEDFGLAENLMIAVALQESGARVEIGDDIGPHGTAAWDAFERSVAWLSRLLAD